MNKEERTDETIYKVVVNDEEQYSIWPADRENAFGWNDAGKTGTRQEVTAYIKEVWTDMRPRSLQNEEKRGVAGAALAAGGRSDREDQTIYKVIVNHEDQYSIWPADRENPLGWNDAGKSGTRAEVIAYIEEVWTDMRPLSLRKKMEEERQRREKS
jgi:MbtH protein